MTKRCSQISCWRRLPWRWTALHAPSFQAEDRDRPQEMQYRNAVGRGPAPLDGGQLSQVASGSCGDDLVLQRGRKAHRDLTHRRHRAYQPATRSSGAPPRQGRVRPGRRSPGHPASDLARAHPAREEFLIGLWLSACKTVLQAITQFRPAASARLLARPRAGALGCRSDPDDRTPASAQRLADRTIA
jgi:hypothetical protein